MCDIKIFVSHRIDLNSELIPNPLYIPVRCGAVFDSENPRGLLGDDTGDNISEKRSTFCEFTVQYWAWKNMEADYYGLCHYRRYLLFTQKRFRMNPHNMVQIRGLLPWDIRRFELLNARQMENTISNYDVVIPEAAPVCKIPTPKGKRETVRQLWDAHDGVFFEKESIDLMFRLIDELAPEYSHSAVEYFSGKFHRGYNCYVMRKELFERLCSFQFPILFELERRLDMSEYDAGKKRTPGYIGEMLYGIFLHHLITRENWRIKEVQMLFISDIERPRSLYGRIAKQMCYTVVRVFCPVFDVLFPIGTKRRECIKHFVFAFQKREHK